MLSLSPKKIAGVALETYSFALAGLARLAASCTTLDESVCQRLQPFNELLLDKKGVLASFREYLKRPSDEDSSLLAVAAKFQLTGIETLAVRLAIAAEASICRLRAGHRITAGSSTGTDSGTGILPGANTADEELPQPRPRIDGPGPAHELQQRRLTRVQMGKHGVATHASSRQAPFDGGPHGRMGEKGSDMDGGHYGVPQ